MMTDSAVKTPKKRRSGGEAPPSGKKQKLNGTPKTPQTQGLPNKGTPQKKLKPFAGTGKLENNENVKKQPKQAKNNSLSGSPQKNNEKPGKKRKSQFYNITTQIRDGDDKSKKEAIKKIEDKIKAIENRPEKTKTALRKLRILQKLKSTAEGKPSKPSGQKEESDVNKTKARRERRKKAVEAGKQSGAPTQKQIKKGAKHAITKPKQEIIANSEDSSEESEEAEEKVTLQPKGKGQQKVQKKIAPPEDDSEEDDDDDGEEEEDEDGDDDEGEDEEDSEDGGESDEDEEDGAEGSDDEDSNEESEEEQSAPKKLKETKLKSKKQNKDPGNTAEINLEDLEQNDLVKKDQRRYILFAGNIPYDATKQDLFEHFKKAGEIVHVRIPTEKGSNKPRGFAYIEVKDNITYQKCLSMHHSSLKGRRINVLYTQSGKKKTDDKKKEVKAKNLKLHALRKQGKLIGSVKETQKRSFRRKKIRNNQVNKDSE